MKVLKTFLIAALMSVLIGFGAKMLTADPAQQTALEAGAGGLTAIWGDIVATLAPLFAGGGAIVVFIGLVLGGMFAIWLILSILGSLFGGIDTDF